MRFTFQFGHLVLLATVPALAADPQAHNASSLDAIDNVTIIGHRRDVSDVPGSAHVISEEELEVFLQSDVMRVLRSVPGVYVQEEDGFGLRPNIGIRGSGLDRSARIALLEDGVLIAPAPYAAASAYYFPTQRRMHSLEVLKGPSAVNVGPRTTGGAINLISTPIPDDLSANIDLRLGEYDSVDIHLNAGDRGERFSWLVETVQSDSDGFKTIDSRPGTAGETTGYAVEDYLVKLQFDSDPGAATYQSLRLKAGRTNQVSNETYLGLTAEDFSLNPNRRYAASAGDVFNGQHEQLQLSYVVESDASWRGKVTVYRNDFERDWFKVQSVNGIGISQILDDPVSFATEYGYVTGDTSPDDAILKRHNARTYYSQGVQGALTWNLEWNAASVSLTAGARLHEDEEDRLQRDSGFRMQDLQLVQTSEGPPGSATNRVSSARVNAFFVSSEIRSGDWILTPGLRFEDMRLTREDYSTSDPTRSLGPTRIRENEASVLIPGLGALYRVNDSWRLLAGIHRGYNPPSPGSSADEESSINVEFGARYSDESLSFESIYFINDYENLVGTVTASTGGNGQIGDQFDGGEVSVQGLELSGDYTFDGWGQGNWSIPVSLEYTWTTRAEFRNAFESAFEPWGTVAVGDELPYIPKHQLRLAGGLASDRIGVNLAANYVGRMRTEAGQGDYTPDRTIQSHVVWDIVGRVQFTEQLGGYLKVDNLFDETYVAARRPAGLRPGLERMAWVGLSYRL
ncbi:MAG: TonB-dependent receptor [Woeseia sp.]|nr:TonB-dependent receptor [Woeseia sp.]